MISSSLTLLVGIFLSTSEICIGESILVSTATTFFEDSSLSFFQKLLIPEKSNANSVGVLSNILLKAHVPNPAIAPKGPP